MDQFPQIEASRKTGDEQFHSNGKPLPLNLLSFWQWSASDIIGNAMRGILAEYIVTSSLNQAEGYRTEWDAYDIETLEGIKIEVKSAAYIQSWSQKQLSSIQFGIKPTKGWEAKTNTYSNEVVRQSDVYVFCLLQHKDQDTINPLNMDQWKFYVLAMATLNHAVGHQKTISLSRLKKLNPVATPYEELGTSICSAANKL